MATDEQRLLVSLEAKIDKFDKAMAKAAGTANSRTRQIEQRFQKMNANVNAGLGRIGAAFSGALAANQFRQFADAATRIDNALKIAGLSGAELTSVYESLKASALENAVPLESLAELYSRVAIAQKELGVSSDELKGFVNNIAAALRVGGRSAAETSGALLQLTQALGSGTVRAEEFNSMQEGMLPVLQAAAAGLEEAGGSVARLRSLVIEGRLSSQAFYRAIEAGADTVKARLAGSQLTIAQSAENMRTTMIDAVGQFDKATGASAGLTGALNDLSGSIKGVGDYFRDNATPIKSFTKSIGDMFAQIEEWKTNFRERTGLTVIEDFLDGTSLVQGKIGLASEQIKKQTADLATASNGLLTVGAALSSQPAKVPPKTVSIADFPVLGKAKGGASGQTSNAFQNELDNIRERTALLDAERDARARIDPLSADYNEQVLTAVTRQRLLNAAQEEGRPITAEVAASIDKMAAGYARASIEADKLEDSQRRVQDRAEEMARLERDVMGGFISDLREGTSAAEMLSNALNKIADKLIDMSLDSLFAKPGAGGVGGLSGVLGLFKGYASGGYTGNGGKHDPAGIVHKGEFVMNASATRANRGLLEAMNSGATPGLGSLKSPSATPGGAGNVALNIGGITINAPNSDAAAIQQLGKELPRIIEARVLDMQSRGKLRGR